MFFESLAPLLPFLIVAFNLNHVQAGQLGFVYYLVYGLLNYPSGHWCDRFGRKFFIMLFLLIASAATMLMAFAPSYICLLLLCALAGLGGGLYHPPGTALISDHFERSQRGGALGFHASGGALGILLAFVMVGGIASVWNWKAAVIALAAIGFALALCFHLLVWDIEELPDAASNGGQNGEASTVSFWTLLKWLPYMFLLYGIVMFVWKGAYTWIPTYLTETYGFTPGRAITFSVILPVIGIFSNYIMGKLSDRWGRKLTLFLVFACLALCFFFLFLGQRTFLIPLLFLFGFAINSFSGIINAYIGDYLPPQVLGRAFGLTFTFSISVSAFAPYVMGYISDRSSLTMSMLFLGLVSVVGALVTLRSPRKFST
jgi:MFS family permease